MKITLWNHIQSVRNLSPLVHSITNYVVMNNTANALLAAGASPIMAHAKSEVTDMVGISHALVVNIGTLDEYWEESMLTAAKEAHSSGKVWILDPVGAGATPYRDRVLQSLLVFKPTIIRGNASEIIALARANKTATKGVDSTAESDQAVSAARFVVKEHGAVVCISGATDIIVDNNRTIKLGNGHPLMAKVTGLGCSASALTAAFAGVVEDKLEATAAAMSLLGVAGELAEKQSKGPGSLQLNLIDKIYNLTRDEFLDHLNILSQ